MRRRLRAHLAAIVVLLGGAVALIAVWTQTTPAAVPLYDGLCLQHPYDLHPSPVTLTLAVTDGDIQTSEISVPNPLPADGSSPQVELVVASQTLVIPPGATKVLITISAVLPAPAPPQGKAIDGLLYRVTAVTNTGATVSVRPGSNFTLVLATTSPTVTNGAIAKYSGRSWSAVPWVPLNCTGSLALQATSFGEYAVVVPTGGAHHQASATSSSGGIPVWVILAVLVIAFAALVVALRRRSRSNPQRRR